MVTEAREGSRKETENFELMKRKALEFQECPSSALQGAV